MTRRKMITLGSIAGAAAVGSGALLSQHKSPRINAASGPGRFASTDGLLRFDLTATEQWVELAGQPARLYSFNGRVPGPLIEVRPGDDVRLRFKNNLPEPTNLHYHGLHLPPTGPADNVFLQIASGDALDYAFTVPANHPAGFFWVHPHLHGSVAKQVSRGLVAPFVIRGDLDDIPEVAAAREHFLILQDFDLNSEGSPREPGMSAMMLGREGSTITVSGRRNPQYRIEQNGVVRLRLLNASASRFYRLKLEDHPLHVIATDGGAVPTPQTSEELLLAPGERRDVLVQGTRESGTYRLLNVPYDRGRMGTMGRGMMGGGMMRRMSGSADVEAIEIASFRYEGRAERPTGLPRTLIDVPALPPPPASAWHTFELGEAMGMMRGGGMGMRFLINGREFDHDRIDTKVRLGTVEEWEYINGTTMDHPMHLHTNSFQLIGSDGQPELAWRDIVVVKALSRARLRIRFEDFTGKTVQHCHILDHEDRGMMAITSVEV